MATTKATLSRTAQKLKALIVQDAVDHRVTKAFAVKYVQNYIDAGFPVEKIAEAVRKADLDIDGGISKALGAPQGSDVTTVGDPDPDQTGTIYDCEELLNYLP